MAIVVNPRVLLGQNIISDSDSLNSVVQDRNYDSIDSSASREESLSLGHVKKNKGVILSEDEGSETGLKRRSMNQSNMESQLEKYGILND